jgi:beta-lactamase superfamily II metal-dependent hydrolase
MAANRILPYMLILCITSCGGQHQRFFGTYEAESGQYRDMMLLPDQEASGGKYLSIQQNSDVQWKIPLEKSGYYQLVIRYRTRGGDQMQYLIKNGKEIGIGFDMSDSWNLCSQPFYLDSGTNTLGIRDGWGSMDLDWISIERAEPDLRITPQENRYYLEHPRDLVFKIDHFGEQVIQCKLNGVQVAFDQTPYPHQEHASWLTLPAGSFSGLVPGAYELEVKLESGKLNANIVLEDEPRQADLAIVTPDVEHGSAMLLKLPGSRYMLIDCGKHWVRDSILLPMLDRHGVDTLHTLVITHYHPDHDGGDSGKFMLEKYHVQQFIDYRTHPTGTQWTEDGVRFRILNSYEDGKDENTRSLSLAISYKDFRMVHGGDTYGINQQMILQRFPDEVPADVYYANHHFHGSVYPEYIRATDPDLVLLQAQEAIYARAAYMVKYRKESEQVLNRLRKEPVETLPAIEVGTVVLRINNGEEWSYETYRDQDAAVIPGI